MYLSRVKLDETRRETMRMLSLPNLMHGAIEQSFPGERRRRLWRIDRFPDACDLLVLSDDKPDFTNLCAQFCPDTIWDSRAYQPLLDRIENGQVWQFRLCANPVHSVSSGPDKRGRVYAHVTQQQQREWLLSRSQGHGFALRPEAFDVISSRWYTFRKAGIRKVTLRTATFEGLLTVSDADVFRKTLVDGIGREKAYGCGLLTIMRPRGESSDG